MNLVAHTPVWGVCTMGHDGCSSSAKSCCVGHVDEDVLLVCVSVPFGIGFGSRDIRAVPLSRTTHSVRTLVPILLLGHDCGSKVMENVDAVFVPKVPI